MRREKEDTRVRITKQLIKDALSRLIKTTSSDKITVSMLCEEAGINRGTFYSHYKDVDDLKHKIIHEYLDNLKKIVFNFIKSAKKENLTTYEFLYKIVDYARENKSSTHILISSNESGNIFRELLDNIKEVIEAVYPLFFTKADLLDLDLFVEFVCAGSISVVTYWVTDDMRLANEIVAEKMNKLVASTLAFLD